MGVDLLRKKSLQHYALSLGLAALILLLRWNWGEWLGGWELSDLPPLAVLLSALYGGLGPGLLTTALLSMGSKQLPEVAGFVVISIVVTLLIESRHKSRRKLMESESLLRKVTDSLPQLIGYLNADGTYGFNNKTYLTWFGRDPEAIRGRHMREVIGNRAYESVLPMLKKALSGQPQTFDIVVPHQDGAPRNVLGTYTPDIGADGNVRGVILLAQDVTEIKRAEQERAELMRREMEALARAHAAREHLYSVFVHAPALVCLNRGPEHRVELLNPQALQLLGLTDESEIIGHPIGSAKVMRNESGRHIVELLDRAYRSGQPERVVELEFLVPGQEPRYYNAVFLPMRAPDGNIEGMMTFAFEVTSHVRSRLKIERLVGELREAIRARDEFISVASHELLTPITGLQLQAELYRDLLGTSPQAIPATVLEQLPGYFKSSDRQLSKLTRLVEDMLDVTRMSKGRLAYQLDRVDLAEVVRDSVASAAEWARTAGCELEVRLGDGLFGAFDRYRIEQVMSNLLSNATKYGAGKPVAVELRAEARADGVRVARLEVRDQGMGIDPEDHGRIFERFERATPSTQIPGLGLGLYITRQIVEAHQGRVRVESAPGRGAAFIVELPLA